MKKVIFSIMIATVSLMAFDASAQEKKCDKSQCQKEACEAKTACCKEKKAPCPFDGLNLTQEQQDKLKALQAPCKKGKADRKAMRQQRDSLARAAKEKHLADIKAILTPEQYVKYLENIALQPDSKQGRAPRHDRRGGKMGQPGCAPQGQCPQGGK